MCHRLPYCTVFYFFSKSAILTFRSVNYYRFLVQKRARYCGEKVQIVPYKAHYHFPLGFYATNPTVPKSVPFLDSLQKAQTAPYQKTSISPFLPLIKH